MLNPEMDSLLTGRINPVGVIDPVQERAEIIENGFRGLSLVEDIIYDRNPEFDHQSEQEKIAVKDVRKALSELVLIHNSSLASRGQ